MKPVAYLAGPLGFSEAGVFFQEKVLLPMLAEIGFEVLNPWTLTPQAIIDSAAKLPYGQAKKDRWREVNKAIGWNNTRAIEESNLLIAILDGADVDSGTAAEIGYGTALGKTTIGYRGDFRLSADNEGNVVNLQVEFFIHMYGGEIASNLLALRRALTKYKKEFVKTHTS